MWKQWVRERGTDCYCPLEGDTVVTGMNLIGTPEGEVVGEFYFDAEGNLFLERKP